jgi:putative phosphoesterase
MKTKIGVISDTHIPMTAPGLPQAILEEFKTVDLIVHAGDLVSPRVLAELKSLCPRVKAVRGNMDSEELKNELPEREIFCVGSVKIALAHGWGAPANLVASLEAAFKKDKPDIIIFGHSHSPMSEFIGGILYFNPGSPTDKAFAPYNSYGIIEINDKIEARLVKL